MPGGRKRALGMMHPGRKRAHENRLAEMKREIAASYSGMGRRDILMRIDSRIRSIENQVALSRSDANLLHTELMLEALDGMIRRSRSVDKQTELRRRKVKLHDEFQRQMEARVSAIKYAAENARRK